VIATGGPVISTPKVISVTFHGDGLASQLDAYGLNATSGSYWDSIRAGYCIGPSCIGDGTGVSVLLTADAGASYTDNTTGAPSTLQTTLASLITAGTVPAPDANTIYLLYFPSTTQITLDGSLSCTNFYGYHNQMTYGAQTVVYAVDIECPAPAPLTLLQNTTITASHELIESASDGIWTGTTGGFYLNVNSPATWGWNDTLGGEIGDLCVDPFGLGLDETTDAAGYTVQRIWSIDNATAGKNPCVPIPTNEVYFNAYTSDSVVVVDVGHTTTLQVNALADGPMAAWYVSAHDWSSELGGTPYLQLQFEGVDGGAPIQLASGQRAKLDITLLKDPGSSTWADGVIFSANGTGGIATAARLWPFIVVTSAEAATLGVTTMRHTFNPHPRKTSDQRAPQVLLPVP
jgi:hypothetical protein